MILDDYIEALLRKLDEEKAKIQEAMALGASTDFAHYRQMVGSFLALENARYHALETKKTFLQEDDDE